ncbi:camp-dependent protein kinase catalytic subunit, partial [Borealophlyctis nickersoniae]
MTASANNVSTLPPLKPLPRRDGIQETPPAPANGHGNSRLGSLSSLVGKLRNFRASRPEEEQQQPSFTKVKSISIRALFTSSRKSVNQVAPSDEDLDLPRAQSAIPAVQTAWTLPSVPPQSTALPPKKANLLQRLTKAPKSASVKAATASRGAAPAGPKKKSGTAVMQSLRSKIALKSLSNNAGSQPPSTISLASNKTLPSLKSPSSANTSTYTTFSTHTTAGTNTTTTTGTMATTTTNDATLVRPTPPAEPYSSSSPAQASRLRRVTSAAALPRKDSQRLNSPPAAVDGTIYDMSPAADTTPPMASTPAIESPFPCPLIRTDTRHLETAAEKFCIDEAVRVHCSIDSIRRPSGEPVVLTHQKGPTKYDLSDFVLRKNIGEGGFAKVYLVTRTTDGKPFALKSMRKTRVVKLRQVDHISNEKQLMESIDNPFVATLEATFQDSNHVFMLMEYLPGGDLFALLKERGRFPEDMARFYAAEVGMGLSFLHSRNIVYRDLKPENVLIDATGHIKLGDFGFAKTVADTTNTFCGTPCYIAPEIILKREYTHAVDWWSYGVLIFEMLSGCSPFQDTNNALTYERIIGCAIGWPRPRRACFSEAAEDLIIRLLTTRAFYRLGSYDEAQIRDHPFFEPLTWKSVKSRTLPAPYVPRPEDTAWMLRDFQ